MGLFSLRPKAVEPLDARQASEWIGVPAGTIYRDDKHVASMYCAAVSGLEPGGYYPCTIMKVGRKIVVKLGNKVVSTLDDNCFDDGAYVLKRQKARTVNALLYPRGEGRKTAAVYARI